MGSVVGEGHFGVWPSAWRAARMDPRDRWTLADWRDWGAGGERSTREDGRWKEMGAGLELAGGCGTSNWTSPGKEDGARELAIAVRTLRIGKCE